MSALPWWYKSPPRPARKPERPATPGATHCRLAPEGTFMSDRHGQPPLATADPAGRIRAIAAGLAAAGVAASTNGNHLTGLDVTATIRPPGRARTEIMLDEDGYAEIRWHTNPAAS